MAYQSLTGQTITMGKKIAAGGEAIVYHTNIQGQVAKIYKDPPAQDKVDKLKSMIALGSPAQNLAWPVDIIIKNKQCAGYLMPALSGEPLHQIVNKTSQVTLSAQYQVGPSFLHHIAVELCSKVNKLHQQGIIVGDLNDSNFSISAAGEVYVLDCDSFQYKHWLCGVGRLDFTAPELQSVDFESQCRTKNADNFSLAIVLYQILVIGQHPYMGKTPSNGCNALHERIKQGICPLIGTCQPSKLTPPIGLLPAPLVNAFKHAFTSQHNRPTANEFKQLLLTHTSAIELTVQTFQQSIGINHKIKPRTSPKKQPQPQKQNQANPKAAFKQPPPKPNKPQPTKPVTTTPAPTVNRPANKATYKMALIAVVIGAVSLVIANKQAEKKKMSQAAATVPKSLPQRQLQAPPMTAAAEQNSDPLEAYWKVFGTAPIPAQASLPPVEEDPMASYEKIFADDK